MALRWVPSSRVLRFFPLIAAILFSSLDPRIKRIKDEEKKAREAKKRGVPAKKTQQEIAEEARLELEAQRKKDEAQQKEDEDKVCQAIYIYIQSGSRSDSQINSSGCSC